ncbi:hypothetical protein [Arabiibacter massiliensis]|uniref:hypothetical protein n=1 Tax=Arabiibacter massiliensis TaxID=1870985 RepID=UPI0009B9DA17|nr:hypothetical protein [Arabiibacter massiliensis]
MNVKEAAMIAAKYAIEMETLLRPDETALYMTKSGFAIEGLGALANIVERRPLQDARTYKTIVISDESGEVVSYESTIIAFP